MEKIYNGEIQRLLPIFQAMADGKTIQTKNGNGWIDIDGDEDGLNLDSLIDYQDCFRIKPEPKYRPFKGRRVLGRNVQASSVWVGEDRIRYSSFNCTYRQRTFDDGCSKY